MYRFDYGSEAEVKKLAERLDKAGKVYALAETDEELFVKKLVKKSNLAKGEYQKSGFAYALSKNFVVWYAQKSAFE